MKVPEERDKDIESVHNKTNWGKTDIGILLEYCINKKERYLLQLPKMTIKSALYTAAENKCLFSDKVKIMQRVVFYFF